jgi:glycosyltransferase involved in cell wall biosynthesis
MIKERFIKFYRLPKEKIVVIPSGVDLERFKPTPLPNEKIVLYYGTLAPHRSVFLLKIIEEVCNQDKEVKFIILGDAPRFFTEYILRNSLVDRVLMPGYVNHEDLPSWLQMARVCLFPQDISLGGRFSVKLFEYMAAGRPIVATDVDESWPIREAGSGLVVPTDPKSYSSAVIELLNDDELAKNLASRGVEYSRNYDWSLQISKYCNLIEELL